MLLPDPETPVTAVSVRRGMSTSTPSRLWSRAPRLWSHWGPVGRRALGTPTRLRPVIDELTAQGHDWLDRDGIAPEDHRIAKVDHRIGVEDRAEPYEEQEDSLVDHDRANAE